MTRLVPKDYWHFHSRRCGTEFRGCAPECPKDTYERTGEWTGPSWPLAGDARVLPAPGSPGAFGVARKHDVHTGVDIYCLDGTEVRSVERGVVASVVPFTGPDTVPPSPWWNPTMAVLVEGAERVLCYGEVEPLVAVGDALEPGQPIGRVLRVLKKNKGTPTSMLHFEEYARGTREPVWWNLGEPRPANLIDPTGLLRGLLECP